MQLDDVGVGEREVVAKGDSNRVLAPELEAETERRRRRD